MRGMSNEKAMNKRIREKIYKRKFQTLFAWGIQDCVKQKVKPSRVKLSVYEMDGDAFYMKGKAYGIEITLRLFPDKEKKQ